MINDQPLDLKLVYNPINSICILPMNHRDKQISILHLKLGPAP